MGNYLLVTASMTKKPNVNEENSPIKRFRYEEDYDKNDFKDTSVYNTLIIAIYPTSKESYPIIKEILEKLEIEGIEYLFSQDIKVNTPKLVYGKKYIQWIFYYLHHSVQIFRDEDPTFFSTEQDPDQLERIPDPVGRH